MADDTGGAPPTPATGGGRLSREDLRALVPRIRVLARQRAGSPETADALALDAIVRALGAWDGPERPATGDGLEAWLAGLLAGGGPAAADGRGGLRVLVVEDETVVAMDIASILRRAGHAVIGPVGRLDEAARRAAATGIGADVALLDVNLAGELVFPVADVLAGRGTPFLFLTGYDPDAVPERFRDRLLVRKPFTARPLLAALERAAAQGAGHAP